MQHPNVAAVFGADRCDGQVGVWMELIEGRTLEDEARERGPFPADEVVQIGGELCSALAAVHAAGLLHRDIKPQNVMRDRRAGRIVLMDFSAGRDLLEPPLAESGLPRTLAGSPLYIAPELLTGAPASARTDIYSLGVLLFRLITGELPVPGETLSTIAAAHRSGRAASVADLRTDLPEDLVRIIDQMIWPEPSERFASAAEIEQALRRLREFDSHQRARVGRRTWIAIGGVVVGAAAVAATRIQSNSQPAWYPARAENGAHRANAESNRRSDIEWRTRAGARASTACNVVDPCGAAHADRSNAGPDEASNWGIIGRRPGTRGKSAGRRGRARRHESTREARVDVLVDSKAGQAFRRQHDREHQRRSSFDC